MKQLLPFEVIHLLSSTLPVPPLTWKFHLHSIPEKKKIKDVTNNWHEHGSTKKIFIPSQTTSGPSNLWAARDPRKKVIYHVSHILHAATIRSFASVQPTRLRAGAPMRVDVMKFSRLGLCVYSTECGRCLNLTFYDISLICYTGVGPLSLFKLLLIKKIIPKC